MTDTDTAIDRLTKFIVNMNRIEENFGKLLSQNNGVMSDEFEFDLTNELVKVFEMYCTKKERKFGRIKNLSISIPPIYGKNEKVKKSEVESKSKIKIYTLGDNPFSPEYRYTLVKKNETWFIDYKETYDDYDSKWEKSTL